MQTRDQRLAAAVFVQVSAIQKRSSTVRQRYGSIAQELPVLIRTAGLAQALAYIEARGGEEHRLLLAHLGDVLGVPNLAERSREANLSEYMLLTQAALAALLWFKRYAQSVLQVEAGDEAELGHVS